MRFKKISKYLLFLWLIITIGGLYGFSSDRNLKKNIEKIEIIFEEGNSHFLNKKMVNKLLIQNHEPIHNQTKSTINLYSLENTVLKNPYVEKASVFLTIQGTLKTTVKQRTPISRIIDKENDYYIDKQGVKIPLSKDYAARVMLVSGVKNEEDIQVIMKLMNVILEDVFLKKEISGIEIKENKEVILAVRSGNYRIDFGDLNEMSRKFRKLKAFYNYTFKNNKIQNYKTINVKYHNQIVCAK